MNQNNKDIRFKDNPHQYIRGIRFRADIGDERESETFKTKYKSIGNEDASKSNLSELAGLLSDFHTELKSLLYDTDSKTEKEEFRKNLSVNKTWLKQWHKELFYSQIKKDNNKQGKYTLRDLKAVLPIFVQKLVQWGEHSEEIKKASKAPQNERFRHSDIATAIRALSSRDFLSYIECFLMETHTKSTKLDELVKKLKKDLENIREQLKTAEQKYLSSQSSGIEIAKAGFNYYTLNKKSKEYYEKEPQKAKDELDKNNFSKIKKSGNGEYSWEFVIPIRFENFRSPSFPQKRESLQITGKSKHDQYNKPGSGGKRKNSQQKIFQFKSGQETEWIEKYCEEKLKADLKQEAPLTLAQTYRAMKAFKAEQKSIFYEIITHIASNKNSSYQVKSPDFILKGYSLSYGQLNFIGVEKMFSLFQFKEKTIKDSKYTINKVLSSYKKEGGQNNKVTSEKCYQAFVDLTKQIQESGNEKNKKTQIKKTLHPKHRFLAKRQNRFKGDSSVGFYNNNRDAIPYKSQRPKQDRGAFLFGNNCYFEEYGKFCETYKNIAQNRGRLNAQIKGIEKEKHEALQTDFWSLIYCNGEKRQLWLIPKGNRQEAKNFIYSPERKNSASEDSQYLSCFESLTMRALHKLCFAEQSSFVEDMPEDLKNLQKSAKEFETKNEDRNLQENKMQEKSQKKLEFFKKLLRDEYARETLLLKNFNLQKCCNATTLEEFEEYLEKACYHVKKIAITEDEKRDFLNNHDVTVLNISSYDLEERNKNTYMESEDRFHTGLWKAFWKGDRTVKGFKIGEVRLNPEVKIRYRKADEDLKKYFDKKKFPSKFKHRRLQEAFTAHFTLALNAGKRYEELAFAKPEELLNKINDFNQKLNEEMDFKTVWKYGIDRGQKELATLCLVRFNPDKELYKINAKTIVKPIFPKDNNASKIIKCWTLKDFDYKEEHTTKKGDKRTRWAVQNLSYFVDEKYLNNKELFEEKNIACLDLTTAKVIKGKIITNGDVLTYLKLKKTAAKRQIYELFQAGKIQENASLEWNKQENGSSKAERLRPEGVLNIQTSSGEQTIYYYRKKHEGILINKEKNIKYNQQSIKDSLNHYLSELRKNNNSHTPTILKINHLREAITANMVGVICHLQKTYPGFVMLEDLSQNHIDRHRFKNEENISRRLENALYNKFQSLGLVPPHVKDIIQLREQQSKRKARQQEEKKENIKNLNQIQTERKNLEKNIEGIKKGINCAGSSERKEDLRKRLKEKSKEIIDLKEKEKGLKNKLPAEPDQNQSSQIGAIVFVPEERTSKDCPYCEEIQEKDEKTKNEEKFKQHRFICGDRRSCGFDTYHFKKEEDRAEDYTPKPDKQKYKEEFKQFESLDDPDKVAAYNVAKKITKPEEIGKLCLNEKNSQNNKAK